MTVPICYLAAAFFCAAGISLWVWHDYSTAAVPANQLLQLPGSEPVWIRCNDWEFRPATMADVMPGDSFVYPEFYNKMRNMEAAEKYQQFWSALSEDDTAEMEIVPDDDAPGDNWPEFGDIGGGDA